MNSRIRRQAEAKRRHDTAPHVGSDTPAASRQARGGGPEGRGDVPCHVLGEFVYDLAWLTSDLTIDFNPFSLS